MQGGLYTRDYLERGIVEEAAWKALTDAQVDALRGHLAALFTKFASSHRPNEGVTEKDLIYPVLAALGWTEVLVQQQVSGRRRDDIPDALLFADADRKTAASKERDAPLWIANLNSVVFDFVARQKVQGQHLNWFIVEQLPVVPREGYQRKIGKRAVADMICEEVLHLTNVASDMRPFAEDLEYDGAPFPWDAEDRLHRRARLDAIYFRLYGIDERDATYILDTFPIVREQDEKVFGGKYRTKDLILAYMRAFAVGDTESRMAV